MDKQQALDKFEQRTKANGTRQAYGVYSLDLPVGYTTIQKAPSNAVGFMFVQKDQQYGYNAFGGTGQGDALHLVDGRFQFADLRTSPDYGASMYDLKNNRRLTVITGVYVNDAARLWVNDEQVGYAQASDLSKKYKNPYDINVASSEKTLFFTTITPDFKPEMLLTILEDVKQLLLDSGKVLPTPKLYINETDNETSIIVL